MRLPFRKRQKPAPQPLPAGWHVDPDDPSRSIHEPRSGTGSANIIRTAGSSGLNLAGGGGGATGGQVSYVPLGPGATGGQTHYEPLRMPECPACGRPFRGDGGPHYCSAEPDASPS
jgi:hypothetical protein